MLRRQRISSLLRIGLAIFYWALLTSTATASTVGTFSWSCLASSNPIFSGYGCGDGRTWNDPQFSNIRAAATAAGHTIDTAPTDLLGTIPYTHLIIAEPVNILNGQQVSNVISWLANGGILMMFVDSRPDTLANANQILSDLGLGGIQVSATTVGIPQVLPYSSVMTGLTGSSPGGFGVVGARPGYNISGMQLNGTSGFGITGGIPVATGSLSSFLQVGQVGLGTVFVFGDRLDHNTQLGSSTCANAFCFNNERLFINILDDGVFDAPEPTSAVLTGVGLIGLWLHRRRRRRNA